MSAVFPAQLKADQATEALKALTAQLKPGETQTVSLAALQVFDSSALAVMLALKRQAQVSQGDVHWVDVPSRMQTLAQLYGVHDVLQMTIDAPLP